MKRAGKRLMIATVATLSVCTVAVAQRSMKPIPIGNAGDWITTDDYPPEALRAKRSGRVVADIGVGSDGKVISCAIGESSGTTSLDLKTCEIVMARGVFNPATDQKGRPTTGIYRLPVRWNIPGSAPPLDLSKTPYEQAIETEILIGENGNIVSCRVIAKTEATAPDPCAKASVGMSANSNFVRNGQPVRTLVRYRYSVSAKAADPAP